MEKCCYCNDPVIGIHRTREHLVPKSRGGNGSQYNIKPCCRACNQERGNKSLTEWLVILNWRINNYHPDFRCREIIKSDNVKMWIQYLVLNKHRVRTKGVPGVKETRVQQLIDKLDRAGERNKRISEREAKINEKRP